MPPSPMTCWRSGGNWLVRMWLPERAILSTRSQEGPPHLLEQELNAMRERVEAVGMRLHAIENLPFPWYGDIFFGGAQQDEQIEH